MCAEKLYSSVLDMCLREANSSRQAGDQLSLMYLRTQKEQQFWNLIYQFNEYMLPFELFLPYEVDPLTREFEVFKREQKKPIATIAN